MPRYVIIGGGVAGVTAAQSLRALDPTCEIVLLAEEPYPYYYRPKLWEFLAGKVAQDALFFRPAEWYASQRIDFRLTTPAASIHPAEHQVALGGGERLAYDRLLLATGARPFTPPVPGFERSGVFCLRTLDDAIAIRARAAGRRNAVVLGGGLLGLETAHALAAGGLAVTVVEVAPHLLPRQVDREGAAVLQKHLEATGLRIVTGTEAAVLTGAADVQGISLKDGVQLAADLVLFSTGIIPRVELARAAGLAVNRGVVVDEHLRTDAEDLFAAGDAAEHNHTVYGLIQPAIEQARAAAEQMAGSAKAVYPGTMSSATLKIVGIDLASLGEATVDDAAYTILRKATAAGEYVRLTLKDGVLVGAIFLGAMHGVMPAKQLIAARKNVAPWQDRLLEPDFDWQALAKGTLPPPK
jgi:nitrite reductase (NADH) large subunit